MGLFGALFAGVSGLDSQSNKMGVISNNISNVNTVGYKQGQADFDTLVVPSGTTSFSPGGVIGGNQQLVNQQGVISATTSATDVAISGSGMLVVNTAPDGSGNTYYTRAGDFTQDSSGNFVNSNGYYLQALPIDSTTGKTQQANSQNLKTVSISQSATGAATPTSTLAVAANLNAAQATLLGNGVLASMKGTSGTSTVNQEATENQILVGNDVPGTNPNNFVRGNTIKISSGGATTQTDTFTYGGFTIGRNVLDASNATEGTEASGGGLGDDTTQVLDTETNVAGTSITTDGADNTVTVTVANPAQYSVGGAISISGASAMGGILASNINGQHVITGVNTATGKITFAAAGTPSTSIGTSSSTFSVANRTYPFTGNILNATTTTGDFMGSGSTAVDPSTTFTGKALTFTISVNGNTPTTFSYSATPDPSSGSFNSLSTMAQAISDSSGLTATVTGGRLYVSATDPNLPISIVNGDPNGTPDSSPPLAGINWTQELGVSASLTPAANVNYFNSLAGLQSKINSVDSTNLIATLNNPTGASTLQINEANPEQTFQISDGQAGASILTELGIANLTHENNNPALPLTSGVEPIVYSPSSATQDMSSGSVTPQFSKDVTVYDSLGESHTIAMNFVKIGTNSWAMELTAVPASDVNSTIKNNSGVGDGQIASGILTFKGDGSLASVSGTLADTNIPVNWTNGASPGQLTLNLGEGSDTGIIQSAASFNVSAATQNGSPVGELTGVSIDENGYVIASFSNGQTQKMYQVPLASVNNPDGLEAVSGNAYEQTISSGIANLEIAGTSGVGTFTPSALEQSNVDLSTQLTDLIVAQQAYGANSKVLTVADSLLQELDQIIQ